MTSQAQYQSRRPYSNVPGIAPPRIDHLPPSGNLFPSYATEHPATAFNPLQPIVPTQDHRQLPAEDHARGVCEGRGRPPQTGSHDSGWFDHPNLNIGQEYNPPQGRIQYPQLMDETIQGRIQTQEKSRWYSKDFRVYPGYQGFPEFQNVQSAAQIAVPPHVPNRLQIPTVPSQLSDQTLPPTFMPLETLMLPRRHPQTRNVGRSLNKRKAQNPYPNFQQREHVGAGSAVIRKQARDDRLGEGFLSVPGASQMLPDQNVAGGSQLARVNVNTGTGISFKPLQPIQSHIPNGRHNFMHENPFYGNHFRLFSPPRSHHAELAVPIAGNSTDWNHAFFPINQNLQQHASIPLPTASTIVDHNNFGLYSHSQYLPKMSDRNFTPHE